MCVGEEEERETDRESARRPTCDVKHVSRVPRFQHQQPGHSMRAPSGTHTHTHMRAHIAMICVCGGESREREGERERERACTHSVLHVMRSTTSPC